MQQDESKIPPVYEACPPEWLPTAHASADLGYTGFFPPRSDDQEEILTESNVKHGLVLASAVPAETLSLQDNVRHGIVHENVLGELEDLMNQIFARRAANAPAVPASTFRLPSRVTLNDSRRQAWFSDLANPDVPLSKLGKNVPHGAKGHDLLDLLHSYNVAIPRAVWFLRVFGGNETAGLRNKPGYNPTQYSVDWANVMTGYLKKQLGDIALPSAPRLGFNVKQTFKGILSDAENRQRWISRFSYSLSLLRDFYAEGLVDNRVFLTWLVQQLGTCNLAQLGFVSRMADEYLEGMLVSRALTHHFVRACLQKLVEVHACPSREHLFNTETILRGLLLRSFLAVPDGFVSPRLWVTHSTLLESILLDASDLGLPNNPSNQNAQALYQTFTDLFADVKRRNEAMLFRHLPPRSLGTLSSTLANIKLLNSLSGKTDMRDVNFFEDASYEALARKLDLLLTWTVTSLQYGDHRPYAAAGLLKEWRKRAGERAIRHDAEPPDEFIQDKLFDWLDISEPAADPKNLPAVSLLFGQLVRQGLYSYQEYIQRLIARGEQGLSFGQEDCSRHRDFLRWIPLHSSSTSLISQRKLTLYGVRVRETPEDLNERQIRKEIRDLLPELFGGIPADDGMVDTTFWQKCEALLSAPRFEQVNVVKRWLLPILKKAIANHAHDGGNANIMRAFTLSSVLMARIRSYGSILELTLCALENASGNEMLTAVIETLRQHMEVWACMNVMQTVALALYSVHQLWRSKGIHNRALLDLLVEVDNGHHLDTAAREQVILDISAFANALSTAAVQPSAEGAPLVLPEILQLANDPRPQSPANLAKHLWYKYFTASDWAWKVWDNTVTALRQIPGVVSEASARLACARRYGVFLAHVDQHLPQGFDDQILQWFLGSGEKEMITLDAEIWQIMIVVLLHLAVTGALKTTTILKGLIYPIWQMGALVNSVEQGAGLEVPLNAVNAIFDHILLRDGCSADIPPVDIYEAQGLQTRRRDVFREPYFSALIDNLPTVVLLEQNRFVPRSARDALLSLRQTIYRLSVFRLGVYRDLDIVRRAFGKVLEDRTIPEEVHEPLVTALRGMLRDPGESSGDPSYFQAAPSSLSAWKLAATAIEIRFDLKQIGEALARESTRPTAMIKLDRITHFVFHHCRTAEGDFVVEMMTDISREVATKFVNSGLKGIYEMLRAIRSPATSKDMSDFVASAGGTLRVLSKIVEPFQDDASVPSLVSAVQEEFTQTLGAKFEEVKDIILSDSTNHYHDAYTPHFVIFLARLVQFNLRFSGAWTPQAKVLSEQLCHTLVDLCLFHGSGSGVDTIVFPVLLDTLFYLLDEFPADPKAITLDPFKNYPDFNLSDLPADLPPSYRQRLRSLLPFVSPALAVGHLAYADPSNAAPHYIATQNRPWEWTEFLGDVVDPKAEPPAEQPPVRNATALALELFGVRVTGDAVLHRGVRAGGALGEGALCAFQDGLAAESAFARDWRETRVAVADPAPRVKAEQVEDGAAMAGSQRASPALSVRTRGSTMHSHSGPSSATSLRQSPLGHVPSRLSASTTSEVIDVDAFELPANPASHGKRKADDEDDEIEIVEGPVPASSRKKPRAKTASKSTAGKPRAKKR